MNDGFFIEVNCQQVSHFEARICGDTFLSKRIKEEGRIIAVLSDGMGHGVKANMLSTLTATMAMKFSEENKPIEKIADIIMGTLPVDSVRNMSYATFTILDAGSDGNTRILEYENPQAFIIRNLHPLHPEWNCLLVQSAENKVREILTCSFIPKREDRIVVVSDGVIQSGLGDKYPLGWGREEVAHFIIDKIREEPGISASSLAEKVINMAHLNDGLHARDDISCAVLYFREPRKLMICTGPPLQQDGDKRFSSDLLSFEGRKIISGATTASIISREWNKEIRDSNEFSDPDLPPVSYMDGVDLISEGILTLGKVAEILRDFNPQTRLGQGPADTIVKLLLDCDEIHFLVGLTINVTNFDPNLPVELETRPTLIRRISRLLEEKYMKEVKVEYY